ncbi:hypothetical protein DRN84_00245 [Candidatus Geothermarchaeota archaeon]|nr:MAG: hypothetical protein DRN84_00245 [Candidatus Geothermarchaeota archaeon]
MEKVRIYGLESISIKDDFIEPYLTRGHLMEALKSLENDIKEFIRLKDIEKYVKLYIEAYKDFKCPSDSYYLEPIEEVGRYRFKGFTDDLSKLYHMLRDFIVAGIDSSYHHPRGHFLIDFILHNIGYYYERLGKMEGGSGYNPFLMLISEVDADIEIETKGIEFRFIKEFIRHIKDRFGDHPIYLLLDESLNLAYTYGWRGDRRKRYGGLFKEYIEKLIDESVYPIGVFYTRARDLVNGIGCSLGISIPSIQDKHILNRYLESGSRSQVFKVVNEVLTEASLNIYAFYLKIDEMNVIRVEFPEELYNRDLIDDIHRIIYYDSLRNNGYSYILARAHEAAVLRSEDRYSIEHLIAEILKIPDKYLYSAKELFKRRPVA